MQTLLSEAGRAFLRAFVGSLLIFAPGVLSAPDLNQATALGVAALVASIAAGLKVIQVFVPKLAFGGTYGDYINSFVRAFLAAFLTAVLGVLDTPVQSWDKAALTGVLVAAATAGIRAIQGFLSPGDVLQTKAAFDVQGPK